MRRWLGGSSSFACSIARRASGRGYNTSNKGSCLPLHVPVLLNETIAAFSASVDDVSRYFHFVDGTVGLGGHSQALLAHFSNAKVLCIDRDPEVLSLAETKLAAFQDRVCFCMGSYANLATHLQTAKFPVEVDGILVDLGANSFHFDTARRGFSVLKDGPLDMRFNQRESEGLTAADVVNQLSEVQLTYIFRDYGEEKLAKEFAKAIVREREERGTVFRTTKELRECIERIANMWKQKGKKGKHYSSRTHPATRCFQALRIYVNDELQHVEKGVSELPQYLAPNGRLVTIAFHSLEDRPIKTLFRKLDKQSRSRIEEEEEEEEEEKDESDPFRLKRFRLTRRRAIKATAEEIALNSRSRSARLRCLERIQ